MRTDDLDYHLPESLIAQRPAERRDAARLMVVPPAPPSDPVGSQAVDHRVVADLPFLLQRGDLLVINDTRVIPARFFARRALTGGRVEGLYLESDERGLWHVMLRSGGRLRRGESILVGGPAPDDAGDAEDDVEAGADAEADAGAGIARRGEPLGEARGEALGEWGFEAELVLREALADGTWLVESRGGEEALGLLERVGSMPLPPYIQRRRNDVGGDAGAGAGSGSGADRRAAEQDAADRLRYQTVYADRPGSVAAPTAGLHFTDDLFAALEARGVEVARLTLHVGMGTFAPVRSATLDEHPMHSERFEVPASTIAALRRARAERRPIIPVGTTSVRALESLPEPLPASSASPGGGEGWRGATDLLIKPGFEFRFTDGLFTNFHLPRSTLIALVAAKTGLNRLLELYQVAITQRYRFYSYGDAMLIQPPR